jgi:WD40 repeat protein/serine/threonine protein kinase
MSETISIDDSLVQRLPLPLVKLIRRAQNAKTPLDRHQDAYYLWEAALKLLGSVAVVEYAELGDHDSQLVEMLENLARPSVGHWWQFVRRLVPVLADSGDEGFTRIRDLVLGRVRDDLPRAAGLDAALIEHQQGKKASARAAVRLTELFDHLVAYRNNEIGHGAAGQRPGRFYDRMARALLGGVVEILGQLDVQAGRRLIYVGDVRRQSSGDWLVERYELIGESARRIESLQVAEGEERALPYSERVYISIERAASGPQGGRPVLLGLNPLVHFQLESEQVFFLNARRGKRQAEYLCYHDGAQLKRDLATEHRELLARVLRMNVDIAEVAAWTARSQAEEPTGEGAAEPEPAERTIGEFELLSRLGQGGMGVVYRAWQPSLGRQVALKCMLKSGDPKAEARFAREIRALGRVDHPGVVKVFTSGSEADQWFLAMELVEGADLARVCAQLSGRKVTEVDDTTWRQALTSACAAARSSEVPLSDSEQTADRLAMARTATEEVGEDDSESVAPAVRGPGYVAEVVEIIQQLAEAADALHEAGIVHRDIKPGNIMVARDGKKPVLMDLGLAQLADEAEGRLTRTRQFVGTLRYASPEQVLAATRVDRRSDVYSLGATLWELLTLRPLFGATDATPTPDLMQTILVTEPGSPRKSNPAVARDLEAIVLKCLEKDKARRYATAGELAADLRRFLRSEPVTARLSSPWELTVKWMRRRPANAALSAAVFLVGLIGIAAVFWFWQARQAVALRDLLAASLATSRQNEEEALRSEDLARHLAYAAKLTLAARDWQDANVAQVRRQLDETRPPRKTDLRGFEWYYLDRLTRSQGLTLTGHKEAIWSVAYSPDGRRLASASHDRTIKLWDATTGQAIHTLVATNQYVYAVAFHPGGARLASAGSDQTAGDRMVSIWDAGTGQVIRTFQQGHTKAIEQLAYSPDGKTLASTSRDGTVKLWDSDAGSLIRTLTDHGDGVSSEIVFSPDGKTLLSAGGGEPTTRFWDLATGQIAITLKDTSGSMAISADGNTLATGSIDGTIKLWDIAAGSVVRTFRDHHNVDRIRNLAFSSDGKTLASTGLTGQAVTLWDTTTGHLLRSLKGHTGTILDIAFSPDGVHLASAANDTTVRIWDTTRDQEDRSLPEKDDVGSVTFGPDGSYLASACGDRTVKLWDLTSGQVVRTFRGHTAEVKCVAISRDGRLAASAGIDMTVRIWEVATGQEVKAFKGHTAPISGVAFSPDGKTVASGSHDQLVKVWDLAAGREIHTLKGHTGQVNSVAFSPDGKTLVSADVEGFILFWDLDTGLRIKTSHTDQGLYSIAYSPDGRWLASAGYGRSIHVWDAATGQVVHALTGHASAILHLAFSPDSRRLASASNDRTVRIWDPAFGQELLVLRGHTGPVWTVAFSPDGARVASGSADDTVKIWEANAGQGLPKVP